MSILQVTKIVTVDNTTPLILATGNAGGGQIIIQSSNTDVMFNGNINFSNYVTGDGSGLYLPTSDVANAAFNTANACFAVANTVDAQIKPAFDTANAAFAKANNALANTSNVSFRGNLYFPNGDIGIGTTVPVTPLHVSDGNTSISSALYTSDFVTISAQETAPGFNIIAAANTGASRGVFKATRARGTLSSPLVPILDDDTFTLLGTIYDGAVGRSTAAVNMEVDGTVSSGVAPQRLTFWTGPTNTRLERMRIDASGNVGIGTTTPLDLLHVKTSTNRFMRGEVVVNGSPPTYDSQELLQISNTSATSGLTFSAGDARLLTATISPLNEVLWRATNLGLLSSGNLTFRTAGAPERMRIDATGNVGIGTSTSNARLHIVGTANNSGWGPFNYGKQLLIAASGGSSNPGMGIFDFNGTNPIGIHNASGILRIGRMPDVNDGVTSYFPAIAANVLSNFVGIANANPTSALHVRGPWTANKGILQIDSDATTNYSGLTFQYNGAARTYLYDDNSNSYTFLGATTSRGLVFATNTSGTDNERMRIDASGNVSIGQTSTTYKLQVNGSFAANTKSFVIDHPTKPGMKLRYGSLEGPENGVYVRGKIDGTNVIVLPDYWEGLVDLDSITVNLTSIGRSQNPYVSGIDGLRIYIDTENHTQPHCYYHVYAERKDVEKLVVEF